MNKDFQIQELLVYISDLQQQIVGLPNCYPEVSTKLEILKNSIDALILSSAEADNNQPNEGIGAELSPFERTPNGERGSFSDAIIVIDHSNRVIFANTRIEILTHKRLAELEGAHLWDVFPEFVNTPLQKHLSIVQETRQAASASQQGERSDTWYEVKMLPVQDGIVLLWSDTSDDYHFQLQYERIYQEFKADQQILQQSINEARRFSRLTHEANVQAQSIFNNLISVAVLQYQNGLVEMANSSAIALFGFDPLRLTIETTFRKVRIQDENGADVAIEDLPTTHAMQGHVVQNRKLFLTNPRGRTYTVLVSSMPMQTGKQITGVVSVWNDITRQERLLAEQRRLEAQQAENEIQVEVQRRLLEHREFERQEIARDLHDGPMQNMISNLFDLQRTKDAIQNPEVQAIINQVVSSIKNSIQDLRDAVNELRPPVMLHLGLARAIRIHSPDFQSKQAGLTFRLDLFDDEKLLSENTCLALYRIYQECVRNIIRHAKATVVSIRYARSGQTVILEIEDNGIGFDIPEDWTLLIQHNHFGLPGMRERAEAVGGQLSIDSEPGSGTRVRVVVPLPDESEGAATNRI